MVSINLDSKLETKLREFQNKLNHKSFTQTIEFFLRLVLDVYDERQQFEKVDIASMQQQLVKALVDIQGIKVQADVALIENAAIGDWVIVHTGFAVQKYSEEEAMATLQLLKETAERVREL